MFGWPTKSSVTSHPLHIKLGLMKQYVKALQRDGNCLKYLCCKFPGLSEVKLKGIFAWPVVRKLFLVEFSETTMSSAERESWTVFKGIIIEFLKNYTRRDQKHKNIVNHVLDKLKELGCNVRLTYHFILSFWLLSRKSIGYETWHTCSEEQGSIIISKRWKEGIKEGGTWKWWQTTAGCCSRRF
jgi:hypothetical protein